MYSSQTATSLAIIIWKRNSWFFWLILRVISTVLVLPDKHIILFCFLFLFLSNFVNIIVISNGPALYYSRVPHDYPFEWYSNVTDIRSIRLNYKCIGAQYIDVCMSEEWTSCSHIIDFLNFSIYVHQTRVNLQQHLWYSWCYMNSICYE